MPKRKKVICQGWRRNGGAFTFGPVKWTQCDAVAIVMLKVVQPSEDSEKFETKEFPACIKCWNECLETSSIQVINAKPITGVP